MQQELNKARADLNTLQAQRDNLNLVLQSEVSSLHVMQNQVQQSWQVKQY
jgi:hypothetical protein